MEISNPIKKISMKINFHSLKTKLLLSILLSFLMLIFILVANNFIASMIIKNKINDSIVNSVKQTNSYLGLLFSKTKDMSYILASNENFLNYSNSREDNKVLTYNDVTVKKEMEKLIMSNLGINNEISSFFVYFEKRDEIFATNLGTYHYEDIKDSTWIGKSEQITGASKWFGGYFDDKFNMLHTISFICRADVINKNINSRVFISVNFNEDNIYNIINNIKITPNTLVYLLDEDENIIAAEDNNVLGKKLDYVQGTDIKDIQDLELLKVKIKNKGYYQAIYQKNPANDWGILVLLPENEVLSELRNFWYIVVASVVVSSIILIFLTLRVVINYVNKPVNKLVSFMQKAESGDFEHAIDEQRHDEFGYLYLSYNEMIRRIKQLIRELYQEKLLKNEIELKVLQSRINPHFLYNTLESINWIAKINKVDDISKMVIALSNLYRTAFNRGLDFITVDEMVQTIKDYLYIQKIRYGSKFEYHVEVEEEAKNILVLNLILQPIVENAIIHGIGEIDENGKIAVYICLVDNLIIITVRDSGIGMSESKLNLLELSVRNTDYESDSGLKNVQKRIELIYGKGYGMKFRSNYREGTAVSLSVPFHCYLNDNSPSGKITAT